MDQKVFCIPGFGVDEKIFANLHLPGYVLHIINWLDPEKEESLEAYSRRMALDIDVENPIIMGISFGGMVALEMARFRKVKKIILISSIKYRQEMPWHMRFAGYWKLNKLFPVKKIQQSDRVYAIANKRLGAHTEEEKEFANAYRRTAKLTYINWSFDKILNWKNDWVPEGTVHIHGDKDQIFPLKTIAPTHVIAGGTHMMIWNRANEISTIILAELNEKFMPDRGCNPVND